jgi:UDP-N-acetylglucosamine--N-acetylmuramyl-(pentapeptide) pyrophosphoryl-undecaprenol N-acetylglucosamine transferase
VVASKRHRIIIGGGGTGGHVYPAIAIADALKAAMPEIDILFVGAEGKLEIERVPKSGYKIIGLPVTGFQRKLTMKNFLFPIKLFRSMVKARAIVKRFNPTVVIGVGGYASGPILRSAGRMDKKVLIQEQNSYPGVTNRLLAGAANTICVAYQGMDKYFPAEKIVITGNPVRKDINDLNGKRSAGIEHFGLNPAKQTVMVIGGSLGARTLNRSMNLAQETIAANPEIQWLWQCGKIYYEEYKELPVARLANVRLLPFIEKMDLAYAVADVVISRAGALSISEICITGKPSILVPSPNVAEDHQTKNARYLVNAGAADLISDDEAPDKLVQSAIALIRDEDKCKLMHEQLKPLARPDAAQRIAGEVIHLLKMDAQ